MIKKDRKRFRKFINKQGPYPAAYCIKLYPEIAGTRCEEWDGYRDKDGYGNFQYKGKPERAHRRAYKLKYGKIPRGFDICHKCDNPPCVNWFHLWAGKDNNRDTYRKGRNVDNKGSKNGMSKLTEKDIPKIRELYETGDYYQRELAKRFGVSQMAICRVINGTQWNQVKE